MLFFTPHTLTVLASISNVTNGRTDANSYTDAGQIKGQVSADDPNTSFEAWGVNAARPHKLLCDLSAIIKIGDRLKLDQRTFVIKAVKTVQHGLIGDHKAALLEELINV
jgi:hypothetical protein